MNHRFVGLIALALTLSTERPSSADGPDLAQPRQSKLSTCLATEGADLSTVLAKIAGCAPGESFVQSPDLCPTPGKRIDTSSYRNTRDLLITPSIDPKALCAIETAIAKAQRECATSRRDGTAALTSELDRLLANGWKQEGNFPRADELYCQAYREARRHGSVLGKVGVLQEWAILMVQLDETENAKELVLEQAAIARHEYQSDRSSWFAANNLVHALEFQARVFETLKLPESARVARNEAEQLSAQLPDCEGICEEEIERIE